MIERSFVPVLLLTSSSMLVWAAHFLVIYGFTGFACARPHGLGELYGIGLVPLTVLGATAVAVIGVGVSLIAARRRTESTAAEQFLWYAAKTMAILALAGIVWEGMAALFVPPC